MVTLLSCRCIRARERHRNHSIKRAPTLKPITAMEFPWYCYEFAIVVPLDSRGTSARSFTVFLFTVFSLHCLALAHARSQISTWSAGRHRLTSLIGCHVQRSSTPRPRHRSTSLTHRSQVLTQRRTRAPTYQNQCSPTPDSLSRLSFPSPSCFWFCEGDIAACWGHIDSL